MMYLEVLRITDHDGIWSNSDDRALRYASQCLECDDSGRVKTTIFPVRGHMDQMLLSLQCMI
jgi:hypothetical protein